MGIRSIWVRHSANEAVIFAYLLVHQVPAVFSIHCNLSGPSVLVVAKSCGFTHVLVHVQLIALHRLLCFPRCRNVCHSACIYVVVVFQQTAVLLLFPCRCCSCCSHFLHLAIPSANLCLIG